MTVNSLYLCNAGYEGLAPFPVLFGLLEISRSVYDQHGLRIVTGYISGFPAVIHVEWGIGSDVRKENLKVRTCGFHSAYHMVVIFVFLSLPFNGIHVLHREGVFGWEELGRDLDDLLPHVDTNRCGLFPPVKCELFTDKSFSSSLYTQIVQLAVKSDPSPDLFQGKGYDKGNVEGRQGNRTAEVRPQAAGSTLSENHRPAFPTSGLIDTQ